MSGTLITLDFSELDEFTRDTLIRLRKSYPVQAKKFITKAGNEYRKDLREAYTRDTNKKTGNLLRGVSRGKSYIYNGDEYQVRVYNKAPHANLIERGHKLVAWGRTPKTRDRVDGRHVVGKSANEFSKKFNQLAEEFVDQLLEEGFKW